MRKKYYIYWVVASFVFASGFVFTSKEIIKLIQADVVDIGAVVPVNVAGSTPVIGTITSNCTIVNWEPMIPINDSAPLQNGQYNVDISSSPAFAEIIESSGYRTGTTYSVAATLGASQNYYYRLRAQDPARPTEKSNYSATKMCQITSSVTTSGGGGSSGGGGGGGGSGWSWSSWTSATSQTSQTPQISEPVAPAVPIVPTKDETFHWLKVVVVDPLINTRPVELSVTAASGSTVSNLTLPENSHQLITVKPSGMKITPDVSKNPSLETGSSNSSGQSGAISSPEVSPYIKPSVVVLKPTDTNIHNTLVSYFDETKKSWELVPTYVNKVKQTLDFRAIGVGTYTVTKVTDAGEPFKDIKPDDWFRNFADNVRLMKIYPNDRDGNFVGNSELTRGEAYIMIMKAFGDLLPARYAQRDQQALLGRGEAIEVLLMSANLLPPPVHIATPFHDVPKISRLYPYIAHAFKLDIVMGYRDGTFRPFTTITRAEMAKIIIKTIERRHLLKTVTGKDVRNFIYSSSSKNTISLSDALGKLSNLKR